jgi:SAM-dependent methyltransferase
MHPRDHPVTADVPESRSADDREATCAGLGTAIVNSNLEVWQAMDTPADWWRTFFSGPVVDFWLAVPSEEQTRQEADFLEETLQVSTPARLLDVPCGGGRHCRALAERGHAMTGVDLSSGFLDAARAESAGRPGAITWEHREMRDLPWSEEFDGAFSLGNSFGYQDDDGNAEFLKAVSRALKPGARFVLDTGYVMESLLPSLQERGWVDVGDQTVLSQRRYDPETSRLHVEYRWIRGGQVDRRSMSARLYSYREVVRLLEEAGFADVQGYGSLAREPFRLGSSRLLAVATKSA